MTGEPEHGENGLNKGLNREGYNCACNLLQQLKSALQEEREVIEKEDLYSEEEFRKKMTVVEDLLTGLKKNMPQKDELTPEQSGHLSRLLKKVRLKRVENGELLAAVLEENGKQIMQLNRGRKTLYSYHPPGSLRQELFVKKNC